MRKKGKKESERNLQNKMQNLELQLHWLKDTFKKSLLMLPPVFSWIRHLKIDLQTARLCTCSSRWWIRVGHVASSRGRPLVEAILLGRWWVGIALRSRWRWAIAIHHTRWRVTVGSSSILHRSATRSWSTERIKVIFQRLQKIQSYLYRNVLCFYKVFLIFKVFVFYCNCSRFLI